jgi:hypothetical protein
MTRWQSLEATGWLQRQLTLRMKAQANAWASDNDKMAEPRSNRLVAGSTYIADESPRVTSGTAKLEGGESEGAEAVVR